MADLLGMLGGGRKKKRTSQKKGGNTISSIIDNIKDNLNLIGGDFIPNVFEKRFQDDVKNVLITKGGKKPLTKKGEYIQKLNKHSLLKIQNYAKSLGINIKKRYNGKIINITKKNLIKKIASLKFK